MASSSRGPPRTRRVRPTVSHFDVKSLKQEWAALAQLRDPGWSWDGSTYSANMRTKVPDHQALVMHCDGLVPWLAHAPTGFPSHPQLKSVLESLNVRFGILQVTQKFQSRAAALAAEGWRVMCRHLYNLAVSGTKDFDDPKLKKMVQLIQVRDATGATASETSIMRASDAAALFPHGDDEESACDVDCSEVADDKGGNEDVVSITSDDSDVWFCRVQCACRQCTLAAGATDDLGALDVIPNAAIGGQRLHRTATHAPTRMANRRIRTKSKLTSYRDVISCASGEHQENKEEQPVTVKKPETVQVDDIGLPVRVVIRKAPPAKKGEAYLLHRVDGKYRYLVGMSATKTEKYKERIVKLASLCTSGQIKTVTHAKTWVLEAVHP